MCANPAALHVPLGIYISVPFCRTKCTFCNFASGVASRDVFDGYVERVCADIAKSASSAETYGAEFTHDVDSVYLGGGTPTVLDPDQLARMFSILRRDFNVIPDAEVTVECAPGTLSARTIAALLQCGTNRVSLGVQSFVDQESRAVGRLHTRYIVLEEIDRLRKNGITNISIDLIAGLPHQTLESWESSIGACIATGVPHVSVYMLEVDADSRLGTELIAGGTRYHAHFVPDDEATADFYVRGCEMLNDAGIRQYEISNFSRAKFESRHNLKYWTRRPYLGFGVDAHSMLPRRDGTALRFATPDTLEAFAGQDGPLEQIGTKVSVTTVDRAAALEEAFFLGLRLNRGVDLEELRAEFGSNAILRHEPAISELIACALLQREGSRIALTQRGRLLSNEVFERFLSGAHAGT